MDEGKIWRDGRVLIRPFRESDVRAHYEAVRESISEVGRWLPWCHPAYALEDSASWIATREHAWEREEEYSFGIFDADDGTLLGGCGLNSINWRHRFANLGYWVRTRCTGKGVASTSVRLVARFGFEALHLHRIEIVVDVANTPSRRVAEKVGATREGVLRRRLLLGGKARDAIMFSLVPEDLTQHG